mmetsp:Transcript_7259/g.12536  ORF Transcript_7259/g.12536 Transcript_7259/m.12536 type:complete len:146 (-) Transcript_7259:208-645(-)
MHRLQSPALCARPTKRPRWQTGCRPPREAPGHAEERDALLPCSRWQSSGTHAPLLQAPREHVKALEGCHPLMHVKLQTLPGCVPSHARSETGSAYVICGSVSHGRSVHIEPSVLQPPLRHVALHIPVSYWMSELLELDRLGALLQ